jgi:hypothetical protein
MTTTRDREQAEAVRAMTDLICVCAMRCSCGAHQRLQVIQEAKALERPIPTDETGQEHVAPVVATEDAR